MSKVTSLTTKQTAIHEAGHAVAHERLDIFQGDTSIIHDDTSLGRVLAEGAESVYSSSEARPMVLAYCAGYAALVAAGYDHETAQIGADNDFESASCLIEDWALEGTLTDWQAKAVELMSEPRNITAVARIARELIAYERLGEDTVSILVDVADGNIPEAEYAKYLALKSVVEAGA